MREARPDRAHCGERPGFRYTVLGGGRQPCQVRGCPDRAAARFDAPRQAVSEHEWEGGRDRAFDLCAQHREAVRFAWALAEVDELPPIDVTPEPSRATHPQTPWHGRERRTRWPSE